MRYGVRGTGKNLPEGVEYVLQGSPPGRGAPGRGWVNFMYYVYKGRMYYWFIMTNMFEICIGY